MTRVSGHRLMQFFKDWMLVIGIVAGVSIYLIYMALPSIHTAGPVLLCMCKTIQPALLFAMLFLSFCKIDPHDMKPRRWMAWLLLIQGGSFIAICLLLLTASHGSGASALWIAQNRIYIESFMLCLICPTATACAVVTGKLGGDMAGAVTYTVLINLLVAVVVPVFVPLIYPQHGMTFISAFSKILAKVFPLLMMPCILAWAVRYFTPKLHAFCIKYAHWSFYLWALALTMAILMSTRAIVKSGQEIWVLAGIAMAAIIACTFQFWAGKLIGRKSGNSITAGQVLGQKNTVFGIWMGYTFLDPIVSVAGGFYSICHNLYNTWQLNKKRKST